MSFLDPPIDLDVRHPYFIPFVCAGDHSDTLVTGECVERAFSEAVRRGVGHRTVDKYSLRGGRLAERANACVARDGGHALLASFRGPAVVLRSPLGRGRAFYLFAYRAPNIGRQNMQPPAVEVGGFYVGREIVHNGCPISLGKGKTIARPDAYFTLTPGVGRPQADREDWVEVVAYSDTFLTGLYEVATRSGQSL